MSASERAFFEEDCHAGEQELIRNFYLIDVKNLQNNDVLTVKMMNGQGSLVDGPHAGSQEQLVQVLFVQARDLNAAIQIALKLPQARAGSIEVRSVVE